MVSGKGKEKVADGGGKGKRKWSAGDDDKTGRKRKNRGVLQFFEDAAYQVDEDEDSSDDSLFDVDDFFEDEFTTELNANNEPGKAPPLPHVPKEEEMSEDELDRMMEERYKPGAGFVTYSEDGYEHKKSIDRDVYVPSAKDPTIWKVKCTVGREKYSAICLMQKYADLQDLGTKLQIISACALDHGKGFILIEAEKQNDIYEACKGLSTIYPSRLTVLPHNESSRLITVRNTTSGISEGMWARVKNGKYKGDLAQVVKVNDARTKVTVKLVPRIDLKAMAEKFGGGVSAKRNAIPAQRLISSSELEEFRPLIQSRRDRETKLMFEILDGMMLKDGYLYKRISIDSLSFWGVMPTEDELLKFEPSKNEESTDVQWLSQLFGEKGEKKKKEVEIVKQDKGGGKGGKSEGSSGSHGGNNFEVHDLVFFGRKDFGIVVGSEKDDSVKVLKEGSEGPSVVSVKPSELKIASFDKKLFSVLDQHSNTLSVNDNVRVLDGPLKDRQGTVKKIYRGVLFLYDESEQENNGYICVKAQVCEKINVNGDPSNEKGSEPGASDFADLPSSPKSPFQERENKGNFTRDDKGMFSVGQSLRIRIGPLKGYRCRVLAVRRSDITVKLDSQQKILTVKSEHLSEVRGRNASMSQGEESGSVKPFDFLGAEDSARDWMGGAALSTEGGQWNAGGGSTERTSWSTIPSNPADDDSKKAEDSSWGIKATTDQSSSWGVAAVNTGSLDGWGKSVEPQQGSSGEKLKEDSWGKAVEKSSTGDDTAWGASGGSSGQQTGGWGSTGGARNQPESSAWNKESVVLDKSKEHNALESESGAWGKAVAGLAQVDVERGGWGKSADKPDNSSTWGKADGTSSWSNLDGGSSSGKQDGGSSWSKPDGGSSWKSESAGKSSWGQPTEINVEDNTKGWGNRNDQESGWGSSKPFDSGRGSGGRRGGRGGFRGGRDNYGRGRSFDQGQTNSWNKEGQSGGLTDAGNVSSWSSGQAGGWGNALPDESSKKTDGWRKANDDGKGDTSGWNQGSQTNKDGEGGNGWGSANSNLDSKSSGWNVSKDSTNVSSGWGKSSNANEGAGAAYNSSWNTTTPTSDGNQSSDWSKEATWGSQKTSEENSSWNSGNKKDGQGSSWNGGKNGDGGSLTGWGQSNWLKNGASETGGNQDSTWSGKSNWNSGSSFGENNNQDDSFNNGGRGGGGWRGGRGGRGDRGGFRGRGGSDRGGFGGRGRGDFGGRGGPDREGFRGKGGFRGRGRGDWNNRGDDDSNADKSYSWNSGSNNNTESWKNGGSGGSWKSQRDGDNSLSQSWGQSKGDTSQGGSWSQGGGGWGSSNASAKEVPTSWKNSSDDKETGGWGSSSNASAKEVSTGDKETGGWGSSSDASAKANDWGNSNTSVATEIGQSKEVGSRGKAAASSWGAAPGHTSSSGGWNKSEATDGGQTNASNKDEGPSDSWGKPAASSWGGGSGKGGW